LRLGSESGLSVRVLPERGLDVAEAWFSGRQLAWLSPTGWEGGAWGGGLVTTCGLQNVGAPSEGFPLHGLYSQRSAELLEAGETLARARVEDGPFVLEREVVCEGAVLAIRDVTVNTSAVTEPAPILYHVNLGEPLWSEGGLVTVERLREVIPRDSDARLGLASWSRPPEPESVGERVFEHVFDPPGVTRVRNERSGLELELRWDATALPQLHQWVDPTPGFYAFALEPANCSVLGRAADRAAGRLPLLAPAERRTTSIEIAIGLL
jgi:uncharacterized protein DUF4432